MLDLNKVTAICYDGRPHSNETEARYHKILDFMLSKVNFYEVKLYCTYNMTHSGVSVVKITECGISRYNDWCVYEMHGCFSSDYALVYQDDGFILNPQLWEEEFYQYDYIGAPWPDYLGWNNHKNKVGNGGFSLRSKKLCEFTQTLPRSPANEDAKICSQYRDMLDAKGLVVAPVEVARRFSVENRLDSEHNVENAFGFHGNQHIESVKKFLDL